MVYNNKTVYKNCKMYFNPKSAFCNILTKLQIITVRKSAMKEITLDTTIASLLDDYEGMKDILISINPKYKKLNNPILRRTVAKIATVKQAAIIGGMEPSDLLNRLREAVGQEPVLFDEKETREPEPLPEWFKEKEAITLDANELLDSGKTLLQK